MITHDSEVHDIRIIAFDTDSIALRIRSIRESKRMKQSEVADTLGIDRSNYARLEKRGGKLTLEQLEKIANALAVSPYELLGFKASEAKDSTEGQKLRQHVYDIITDAIVRILKAPTESVRI